MSAILKPLKRFGQHFLKDQNIIKKILEALQCSPQDCILEIGPGKGVLTFELAKKARHLVAVEVDRGLHQSLLGQFKDFRNVDIICGDILKFDLKRYVCQSKIKSFKVIGNLPYYLTTPIIEYLFKNIESVDDIFITVQKEVADRMTAHPETQTYGSFTCFVNYFCLPKILFKIKRGSFWPQPSVESCFVRLTPFKNRKKKFHVKSESLFFRVMRSAFGQRRKKLYSSLSSILNKGELIHLFSQDLLSHRAEDLKLEDFIQISNHIFDFLNEG